MSMLHAHDGQAEIDRQHRYWTCPHCGGDLRKCDTFLCCTGLRCPGFLRGTVLEAPIAADLPLAERLDYKRFRIADTWGEWEYAVGAHKKALDKKPGSGIVLARVNTGKKVRVRAFRKADTPRTRDSFK